MKNITRSVWNSFTSKIRPRVVGAILPPVGSLEGYCVKNEVWKDIPGYEGEYQASTMGRIKSLKRMVVGRNWYTGKQFYRTVPERILKPGR